MNRAFAVIAVTVLTVNTLSAQVHIKENMTITPVKAANTQTISTHTLKAVLEWDSNVPARVFVSPPCGILGSVYYGYHSITMDVPSGQAGNYRFNPQIGVDYPGKVTHATFSIYQDGIMVRRDSAAFGYTDNTVYLLWPGQISYTTPYYSSFDFALYSKRFYGDPYVPRVTGVFNCDSTSS